MKRKILSFTLLLFTMSFAFACRCAPTDIIDEFAKSDYIGEVKVLKVHKNKNFDTNYYEIEVEELTNFKGKFSKIIQINGSNDKRPHEMSCNRQVFANQKMMVYANASNGIYSVGFCGHSKSYNEEYERDMKISTEKAVLENLKKNQKLINDTNRLSLNFNEYNFTETKVVLENQESGFFLYKIQLDENKNAVKFCSLNKLSKINTKKIDNFLKTMDFNKLLIDNQKNTKKNYVLIYLYFNNSDKILTLSDWLF